jgi:hypothetical protein
MHSVGEDQSKAVADLSEQYAWPQSEHKAAAERYANST